MQYIQQRNVYVFYKKLRIVRIMNIYFSNSTEISASNANRVLEKGQNEWPKLLILLFWLVISWLLPWENSFLFLCPRNAGLVLVHIAKCRAMNSRPTVWWGGAFWQHDFSTKANAPSLERDRRKWSKMNTIEFSTGPSTPKSAGDPLHTILSPSQYYRCTFSTRHFRSHVMP